MTNAGVPFGATFVARHVSVLHALLSYGLTEAEATALVAAPRAPAVRDRWGVLAEIRFRAPSSPAWPSGGQVIVYRMRGNHADVYELRAGGEQQS